VRRGIVSSGLAAIVALAAASPAAAAGPTQVQSPLEGSTIEAATPVRVRVQESCGTLTQDTAGSVDARLSADGGSTFPGSDAVALERDKACSSGSEYSEWGGASVDPTAPTAFFGADPAPMCNGRWRVQARADGGSWGTGVSFTVSLAPAAPAGVTVTVRGDDVEVSWTANREPDLTGYRLERRRAGSSSWSEVVTLTGTATSDTDVSAGDWEYRVVALRGDGIGSPPCEDATPDLDAESAVHTASVGDPDPSTSPSPDPSASPGTDGGDSGDGGDTSDGETDGTSSGDDGGTAGDGGSSDGGTDGGSDGDGSDGTSSTAGDGSTTTGGSSRRVGAPPPATRSGPDLDAPALPGIVDPGQQERYYGEDDEYSDALDFGTVEEVEASETRSRSTTSLRTRVVPQAVQEFVSRYVDPDRVLKPIAAGLVLVAFALHLRLWSREHDAAGR